MNDATNTPSTPPAGGPSETSTLSSALRKRLRNKRPHLRRLKPMANSIFARLKSAHREQIVKWLFEENLTYDAVLSKMEQELKIRSSRNPLINFYHSEASKRNLAEILQNTNIAKEIFEATDKEVEMVYRALLSIMTQITFVAAHPLKKGEKPDTDLVVLLLPLLIEARKDAREDKKAALDRERWEFDVVRMCHNHFNDLQVIIANESLDEPERLDEIRKQLFAPKVTASE